MKRRGKEYEASKKQWGFSWENNEIIVCAVVGKLSVTDYYSSLMGVIVGLVVVVVDVVVIGQFHDGITRERFKLSS